MRENRSFGIYITTDTTFSRWRREKLFALYNCMGNNGYPLEVFLYSLIFLVVSVLVDVSLTDGGDGSYNVRVIFVRNYVRNL